MNPREEWLRRVEEAQNWLDENGGFVTLALRDRIRIELAGDMLRDERQACIIGLRRLVDAGIDVRISETKNARLFTVLINGYKQRFSDLAKIGRF